jgi:hypothetical protein
LVLDVNYAALVREIVSEIRPDERDLAVLAVGNAAFISSITFESRPGILQLRVFKVEYGSSLPKAVLEKV